MADLLKEAKKKAWSIENMKAHGAEGREVYLIGMEQVGGLIFRYYQDDQGDFWYKSTAGEDIPERTLKRKRLA